MKKKFSARSLILKLNVLLILVLVMSACEPETKITFENKYNQEVKVLVAHVRDNGTIDELTEYGIIDANSKKTIHITFLGSEWVNRIEAADLSGKVIFSHDYNIDDLEKINWKIEIFP
jgi:hypothetical protein